MQTQGHQIHGLAGRGGVRKFIEQVLVDLERAVIIARAVQRKAFGQIGIGGHRLIGILGNEFVREDFGAIEIIEKQMGPENTELRGQAQLMFVGATWIRGAGAPPRIPAPSLCS